VLFFLTPPPGSCPVDEYSEQLLLDLIFQVFQGVRKKPHVDDFPEGDAVPFFLAPGHAYTNVNLAPDPRCELIKFTLLEVVRVTGLNDDVVFSQFTPPVKPALKGPV
jgi:hypothetical protein